MTTLREAAQQALDDLRDLHANHNITYAGTISRLEAALAQQAEPVEPVAWVLDGTSVVEFDRQTYHNGPEWTPLCKCADTPPQRKPLSEEEIIDATEHIDTSRNGYFIHIARAVERAHGIPMPGDPK